MFGRQDNKWFCAKCSKYIENCIDMDYHENTVHPNYRDAYVKSWHKNGKQGNSPYD